MIQLPTEPRARRLPSSGTQMDINQEADDGETAKFHQNAHTHHPTDLSKRFVDCNRLVAVAATTLIPLGDARLTGMDERSRRMNSPAQGLSCAVARCAARLRLCS